jgi:TetR/AcrR family transcriptional repressor of nem operon
MRVSAAEKAASRKRIVEAAGRRFRAEGIEGAGLAEVMADAGMTHGGFYRHFPDKEALVAAALEEAFRGFAAPLLGAPADAAAAAVAEFRALYLSREHRDRPDLGCPAAALGPDAARAGPAVRAAFGEGTDRIVEALARGLPGPDPRGEAIRLFAGLVGALVLARAVDDRRGEEILAACR